MPRYKRTLWRPRLGTLMDRYRILEQNANHIRLIKDPQSITQEGVSFTSDRMNNIEEQLVYLDDLSQGMPNALILNNISMAGLANRELVRHKKQGMQTGVSLLTNKGIISGCVVTRSTTATRSLNLSAGQGFERGRLLPIPAITSGAAVPQNTSAFSAVCFAYLIINTNNEVGMAVTPLGGQVPANGIPLYSITVPAGSTNETDQFLISCTLSSVRRMEAAFPVYLTTQPHTSVALPFVLPNVNYHITLDVVSQDNTGFKVGNLSVIDRNVNGFKIAYDGLGDNIQIRWQILKPDL